MSDFWPRSIVDALLRVIKAFDFVEWENNRRSSYSDSPELHTVEGAD